MSLTLRYGNPLCGKEGWGEFRPSIWRFSLNLFSAVYCNNIRIALGPSVQWVCTADAMMDVTLLLTELCHKYSDWL